RLAVGKGADNYLSFLPTNFLSHLSTKSRRMGKIKNKGGHREQLITSAGWKSSMIKFLDRHAPFGGSLRRLRKTPRSSLRGALLRSNPGIFKFVSYKKWRPFMKKIISLLVMCLSSPLFAKSITNQELAQACKDPSAPTQNFCYGFIISAANAAQFYRNIVDVEHEFIKICFPQNLPNKQIVDMFIAWVEKNPSVLNSPAFIGVSTSFSEKYSCKKKAEGKEDDQEENLSTKNKEAS
ncbi:MAG: Rap1a/Tai family immunity protein, partial [Steroidobacteraceae bacterium]